LEGMGDSVDVVPIGAYYGKGKRTGNYGAYLAAVYNEEDDEYQSVCKIGTGFSDEMLKSLPEGLADAVVENKPSNVVTADVPGIRPDVWFEPSQVWEIKAADLSTSSTHKGALGRTGGGPDRGIGLRFPRFERLRPDKKITQATSSQQILEMYMNQDTVKGQAGNDDYDDDEL